MTLEAMIFDMDGTLLHTMPDLALAANQALRRMGFPERSHDEMLACMGLGGRQMVELIVPAEATAAQRERTFELWRDLYIESDYALTAPFEGIPEALRDLRARGLKLGIQSNKFDAGVQLLANRHFPGMFDAVRGDEPPMPRKPDPTSLLFMLDQLGVSPDDAAYVGDATVDVRTARNASVKAVGVAWGYDAVSPLPIDELDAYAHTPSELLRL